MVLYSKYMKFPAAEGYATNEILINLDLVETVYKDSSGRVNLTLNSGKTIPLSSTFERVVEILDGYYLQSSTK